MCSAKPIPLEVGVDQRLRGLVLQSVDLSSYFSR